MASTSGNRVKVGIFIAIGLALLVVTVYILGGQQSLFSSTFNIKARYSNISGLAKGATVRFSGINVGIVDNIVVRSSREVEVTLTVEEEYRKFIHADAKAVIGSEGIMGNTLINIDPGTNSQPIIKLGQLVQGVQPASMDDLLATVQVAGESAAGMIDDISVITSRLRKGEGTIGKILTDESLFNNLSGSLDAFSKSAVGIDRVLSQTSGTISYISGKIRNGRGALGRVISDTAFANRLDSTIYNVAAVTQNLQSATKSLDQELEALKYSFLFKKYFEKQGYFDSIVEVDEKAPQRTQSVEPFPQKRGLFRRKN